MRIRIRIEIELRNGMEWSGMELNGMEQCSSVA